MQFNPQDGTATYKFYITPDVPTRAGRIYSRAAIRLIVRQAREMINNGRLWGHFGAPPRDGKTRLIDVSHEVTQVYYFKGALYVTILPIDTTNGRILRNVIGGYYVPNVGVAPRCTGSVDSNQRVDESSLVLGGFDLVWL